MLTHGGFRYSTEGRFVWIFIWISFSETISEGLLGLQSYDNVPIILRYCESLLKIYIYFFFSS